MLKSHEDAFGHEMYDYYSGKGGFEIIERDDGYITPGGGPAFYFLPYKKWFKSERAAMKYVKGSVLDIGCGAGRHALHLMEKGHDVLGIDTSPLAIKTAKARGVRKTKVASLTQVSKNMGSFDTILMLGNNFCMVGNPKRAQWLLKRFHSVTSDNGRIIAQTRNPYDTNDPDHKAYHTQNKAAGRMGGHARIRVRYKKYITPWIDFLMVSPAEMKKLVKGTGWKISTIEEDDAGPYIALLVKC